jgi:exodeoxyribonuclease III
MKLISWNVNGLRSIEKKGVGDFLIKESPDIFCIQETKIGESQLSSVKIELSGYNPYFSSATKKGYSGVATYINSNLPIEKDNIGFGIGNASFDSEGRVLITNHEDFILYNIYFPSGTMGETRQNFKYGFLSAFYDHIKSLNKSVRERLIICGDFNICHREIDIHHPDKAEKLGLSGFLPEERKWMDAFQALGFIDSFRHIHGDDKDQYTWWTYRAGARGKNLGWRIDYIFISEALRNRLKGANILSSVLGSDHAPVMINLMD